MSLSSYIDIVKANLLEELNDPSDNWRVEILKGDIQAQWTGAPPRIVFAPNAGGDDDFAPARQHETFLPNGRSVLTRVAQIQVSIWAVGRTSTSGLVFDDYGATEYLLERTIVAMREAWGSIAFRSGRFLPERIQNRGRSYTLDVALDLPILESANVLVTTESAEVDVEPGLESEGITEPVTLTIP
jgi:hypothetical protein